MLGPELVSLGKRGGRGATLTLEVDMSHPVVCVWCEMTCRNRVRDMCMYIVHISISTVYIYLSLAIYLSIYIYISAYVHIYRLYFLQTWKMSHPSNSPSRRAKTISLIFLRCWRQDPTAFASALARRPGWVPRQVVSESPYVWLRLEPWPWYVGASSFHAGCGSGTFGSPKK